MNPTKIGVVGCGNISDAYFNANKQFKIIDIVAVADIIPERSCAKSEKWSIPNVFTTEQLLADPEIEIVVNLTPPATHYPVMLAGLTAGKHVYSEKPLSITREQGRHLLEMASEKGLRIGCAPDTFLGGGQQTCRKVIDDGVIGDIVGGAAFMLGSGPEAWHPDPEFLFKVGGGPMFDMGPYYLTTLINMLGPIKRLSGSARISRPERIVGSGPKKDSVITVDVPTHISGVIEFASGPIVSLTTSFDIVAYKSMPSIEIYGTKGTMVVPDPNTFGGPVTVYVPDKNNWDEMPIEYGFTTNSRGVGVADMAHAMRSGRAHRASGELANHVLEAMRGFHVASESGAYYGMQTTVERPAAFPLGLPEDEVDE